MKAEKNIYPRRGYLYESLKDQIVSYLTSWHTTKNGGGSSLLKKGERIWIAFELKEEKAIQVDALPVDYLKLEARMVPFHERNHKDYRGFFLRIETKTLNDNFKFLQKDFSWNLQL